MPEDKFPIECILKWLEHVEVRPTADFSVRAFLALHIRDEMIGSTSRAGGASEPAAGSGDGTTPVEGSALGGQPVPTIVTAVEASAQQQGVFEDEALMKLSALQRMATSRLVTVEVCERLKEKVLDELLAQLSAVARCASEYEMC